MMSDDAAVSRLLAHLSRAEPDPARSARVMTRCRCRLAQKAAERAGRTRGPVERRTLELALVGAFCLIYVSAVVGLALHFANRWPA